MCTESAVRIGLDQALPAGYSARDLIEVFESAGAPGFLLPSLTSATDRALEPDDAIAITQVALDFEPADDEHVALFEGGACAYSGFTVFGSLTATTLEGEIVLSAEGGLVGPPERAYFWSDGRPGSTGFPSAELYGPFPSCNPDVSPITAWTSGGVLIGNLCTSEGLVRFPTACGGFAQLPLDEKIHDLPVPSAALERLQSATLEVVWGEGDRSPLELTVTPAELACYEELGYDDGYERPLVRSTTIVEIAVAIEDAAVELRQQARLTGSYDDLDGDGEAVSELRACTDLDTVAVAALNERLDLSFRRVHACLSIIVRVDERLEVELAFSGASAMPRPGAQPGDAVEPEEIMKRVLVLEAER